MAIPVTQALVNNGVVEVTWGDGHESKYHHMWLRDNCACGRGRCSLCG
ncbi:MAG: gamma-butyrobetaine hydroxylase-like domain-containing protein [Chloroflexota bacterium]